MIPSPAIVAILFATGMASAQDAAPEGPGAEAEAADGAAVDRTEGPATTEDSVTTDEAADSAEGPVDPAAADEVTDGRVDPADVDDLAEADPDSPADDPLDDAEDPLARYRTRFDLLADRTIGTTSRPVEFNWRRTTAQVALTGSFLFELNNFNGLRGGALVRFPTGGIVVELGASYVEVWDSQASSLLARTPYRQPGRPRRAEIDFAIGLPLAEGVVTTFPRFFPAVQMVFSAYGGVRYLLYPTGFGGMQTGEVTAAIFAPILTDQELENLDDARLASMQVDPARYGLMFGFGNDLYFKPGLFVSPRVMFAVPILAPATQTDLPWWMDASMALGVAF